MDLRDSPAEAAFRARFRAWLAENNPGLPVSSTDDEYWARQAEWHTTLYDAGFFGLSWPARFGGHDLPPVFDVILDEELAAAGAPPRPSLGYLVQGITVHASEAIQERFLRREHETGEMVTECVGPPPDQRGKHEERGQQDEDGTEKERADPARGERAVRGAGSSSGRQRREFDFRFHD